MMELKLSQPHHSGRWRYSSLVTTVLYLSILGSRQEKLHRKMQNWKWDRNLTTRKSQVRFFGKDRDPTDFYEAQKNECETEDACPKAITFHSSNR